MGKIQLENMEFYAYHGCFDEERIIGARFIVDLFIETDTIEAEKSDDLTHTVNYQDLYLLVKEEMNKKSNLLENVARRILGKISMEFPGISFARIKVSKMNPPLGGKLEKVSLIIEI